MNDKDPLYMNMLIWFCYGTIFFLGTPLLIAASPLIAFGWCIERVLTWWMPRLFEGGGRDD